MLEKPEVLHDALHRLTLGAKLAGNTPTRKKRKPSVLFAVKKPREEPKDTQPARAVPLDKCLQFVGIVIVREVGAPHNER